MESYRIYKSLPLDDFMDMTSFVVAKFGLLLTPLVQDTNYDKLHVLPTLSEAELKSAFIRKTIHFIEKNKENMNNELLFAELSDFYMIIPKKKSVKPDTQLHDKLRELLSTVRECIVLHEQTDVLTGSLYDDFWLSLDAVEGDLTTLKSACFI